MNAFETLRRWRTDEWTWPRGGDGRVGDDLVMTDGCVLTLGDECIGGVSLHHAVVDVRLLGMVSLMVDREVKLDIFTGPTKARPDRGLWPLKFSQAGWFAIVMPMRSGMVLHANRDAA